MRPKTIREALSDRLPFYPMLPFGFHRDVVAGDWSVSAFQFYIKKRHRCAHGPWRKSRVSAFAGWIYLRIGLQPVTHDFVLLGECVMNLPDLKDEIANIYNQKVPMEKPDQP